MSVAVKIARGASQVFIVAITVALSVLRSSALLARSPSAFASISYVSVANQSAASFKSI